MVMAGAGGFQPPVAGTKPAAFPLGYAPASQGRRTSTMIASVRTTTQSTGTRTEITCEAARIQVTSCTRGEVVRRPKKYRATAAAAAARTYHQPCSLKSTSRLSMKAIRSAIRKRRSRIQRADALSRCSMTGWTLTRATLPDGGDQPNACACAQVPGGPLCVRPVVEERVDRRPSAAHVGSKGAPLDELSDDRRAPRGGGEVVRRGGGEIARAGHPR